MHSVKKKQPKDNITQDICGAIEDYLRESDQKETYTKSIYLTNKNYKITSLKNISKLPNLEEDNFINIIKEYNSNINTTNIFNEIDIAFKPIISKSLTSDNLREKEESSQNNEKYEILEDGSICIKNTTGMISPSLGEKYLELKNSNSDINLNKDIEQDILVHSKLLISNNIKCFEDDDNLNEKEYIINNNSNSINSLIRNKNNIFTITNDNTNNINDNYEYNMDLKNCQNLKNLFKDTQDNNYVYFSTSKKNKIKSKNNNKVNITTNVRKKKLIVKPETQTKNKSKNNIFDMESDKENNIKNNNNSNYFLKEIKINHNNNELNYKRILFGDNFKEDDDIINQWKYLCNKYIKEYNKKLLSTNIQKITQNLKIQKILETKNRRKSKNNNISSEDNYFDSIKEEFNNIEQDNIAQSINIIEYNNKNESSDSDYISEPTNISNISQPPIINFNNTYEQFFEEIDKNSEKKVKNINRYRGDIESINEEMNESYEEQELNDNKINNKLNLNILQNQKTNKLKIIYPSQDKTKIFFNISKLIFNFNKIDSIFTSKFDIKKKNENENIDLFCNSPISSISNKIEFRKENKQFKYSQNSPSVLDSEDISISKETETEISDEEVIFDENGKITQSNNNNTLINNYLSYKIEKNNNNIKLIFGNNNIINNRFSINIKSYKKILKMIFYKKKKPISKNSYESLLSIIINNFSIFKKEFSLKKNIKIYNKQDKEILNNNCTQVENKINELEEKIKEMKYYYIYGLIKKNLIKDKYQKKIFIKSLKIGEKRNKIKRIYKEIIYKLNNKINDGEINTKYYQKSIYTVKKYEKINEEDINRLKNKYINNMNISVEDIIKKENEKNMNKINTYNKQKIFVILLPMMFIINYFANNFKYYGYNDLS